MLLEGASGCQIIDGNAACGADSMHDAIGGIGRVSGVEVGYLLNIIGSKLYERAASFKGEKCLLCVNVLYAGGNVVRLCGRKFDANVLSVCVEEVNSVAGMVGEVDSCVCGKA